MEEKKLTIKDGSVAFLSAFLFSQLAIVLVTILSMFICKFAGLDYESYQTFFNTSYGFFIETSVLTFIILALLCNFGNRYKE